MFLYMYENLYNGGGVAATTVSSISNNDIRGIVYAVTASSPHQYINGFFAGATQNINNNTFTNLSVNTTGGVIFISNSVTHAASTTHTLNNNSIVTGYSKTAAGGSISFYNALGLSPSSVTETNSGNNFSNLTFTGATTIVGWVSADGTTPADPRNQTNHVDRWRHATATLVTWHSAYGLPEVTPVPAPPVAARARP